MFLKDFNPVKSTSTYGFKIPIDIDLNPRRAYLLRNIFEQVIDLTNNEDPLYSPYGEGEAVRLHGINLYTILCHVKHYTFEDGIVISESAADKMSGERIITQLIESHQEIKLLAEQGDFVSPNDPLAYDSATESCILASKLVYPATIEEVKISIGQRFGIRTNRLWFKFRSYYPLCNGDKLSNRHGGKGVVTIVPDDKMPEASRISYLDGVPCALASLNPPSATEVCIGPDTIFRRSCLSALEEFSQTGFTKLFTDSFMPQFRERNLKVSPLHNLNVTLAEETVGYPTHGGYMFWMRLDKIAREIVSCTDENRVKNSFGGNIDNAKTSGQRCNMAKLLAMTGRGLSDLAISIVEENSSAKPYFASLVKALRNERFCLGNNL